jgi:hypothetical protein
MHYGSAQFTATFEAPPISITVAPGLLTLPAAKTQQFLATVLNATNTAVRWSASKGTISPTGSYAAPNVTKNTVATITATSVADPTKTAKATVTISTATDPAVSLELLSPPTGSHEPYYDDVQKYLLNNPVLAGVNFFLEWGSVDRGQGANPRYDFSAFDKQIAPWIAAGKRVNVIVWAVSDDVTNTATPQ